MPPKSTGMKPALRIEGGDPAWIGLRGGSEVVRAQAEAYAYLRAQA